MKKGVRLFVAVAAWWFLIYTNNRYDNIQVYEPTGGIGFGTKADCQIIAKELTAKNDSLFATSCWDDEEIPKYGRGIVDGPVFNCPSGKACL